MPPKKDIIDSRGKSKSMAPFRHMIVDSYNERDPAYVPLGSTTPTAVARITRYVYYSEGASSFESVYASRSTKSLRTKMAIASGSIS